MASKPGQKSRSHGTPKWSSPRFRFSNISTQDTDRNGADNSNEVAKLPNTPDQISSTQRELKKLEDYWTRHNPVKEDSPRLRSNRKTKFDIKECLNKSKTLTKNQTCASLKARNQDSCDLSESPIPLTKQDHEGNHDSDASSTSTATSKQCEFVIHYSSPNIFSKFSDVANNFQIDKETKEETIESAGGHNVIENSCPENPPPNVNSLLASQLSDYYGGYLSGCQTATEDNNSNDSDYVPPRKKLRSEVSKDELWEGFPLKVSFKRLAPLSKKQEATIANSEGDSFDKMNSDVSVELKRSPGGNKGTSDVEVHNESSLESTIIYEDGDSHDMCQEDNESLEANDTILEHIPETEYSPYKLTAMDHKGKDVDDQSTPTRRKKRKLELPQTPRKRSARLLEKSFSVTPDKGSQESRDTNNMTEFALPLHRLDLKSADICGIKTEVVEDKDVPIERHSTDYYVINTTDIVHGNDIPIEPKEEVVHTLETTFSSEKNCEDTDDDKPCFSYLNTTCQPEEKTCSVPDSDLLNKSISQILDCGYGHTHSDSVKESSVIGIRERQSVNSDIGFNEINESVSKTLETLLDGVESISQVFEKKENMPGDQRPFCARVDGKANSDVGMAVKVACLPTGKETTVKHRRSSRIAELEKKLSLSEEAPLPNAAENMQESPATCDIGESNEMSDSVKVKEEPNGDDLSLSTVLHNVFKKGESKTKGGNKSVPPLRIRLKLPLKCLPQKQQSSAKAKLKLGNRIAKAMAGDDDQPSTSGTKSQPRGKKMKKKTDQDLKKEMCEQVMGKSAGNENKTKKPGPGKKKGFTPVKGKTSKRYKKDTRRWSPPTNVGNVELRLNSERRVAAVGQLLSNAMLDKHACVLWSSENRRHVQMSNDDATSGEVDEILRRKWENLSEKEKIRYFQRARDAMRDENRHSNRHQREEEQQSISGSTKESPNPSLVRFLSLDSRGQLAELKNRLHFYREVSPEEYNNVMTAYKVSCIEERQGKGTKEDVTKSKSKQKKSKRKSADTHNAQDCHAKYRKLLYEKVCENWNNIVGIWAEKKEAQRQILRDNYVTLVRRLIAGESVDFCQHTTSVRLSEVLWDLRDLERCRKLAVTGFAEPEEGEYESVLKRLNNTTSSGVIKPISEALLEGVAMDTGIFDRIMTKIPEGPLPILDQETLDDVIPDSPTTLPCCRYIETRRNMTSPTSLLNDWVAEEVLASNQNVEFRGAVSLLSNKIIPSPAFVVPQYVNAIYPRTDSAGEQYASDKNNNSLKKNDNSVMKNKHSVNKGDKSVTMSPANMFKTVKTVYNHGFKVKQVSMAGNDVAGPFSSKWN